jgi:hypothetical protein
MNSGDPFDWESAKGTSVTVRIVGFVNMFVSNNPTPSDGELIAEFVQVVPVDALDPGGYVEYAGVITWLEQ